VALPWPDKVDLDSDPAKLNLCRLAGPAARAATRDKLRRRGLSRCWCGGADFRDRAVIRGPVGLVKRSRVRDSLRIVERG
jgi:hypothetical protein